jgi:apolipoprotein N-acyltransferase
MERRLHARWHAPALAAAYGTLTVLSHPDAALSFFGWVSLVPLLLLIQSTSSRRALLGWTWVAGFVGYFGAVGWLCRVGEYSGLTQPWGWVAGAVGGLTLGAYMGLYVALFAWLVKRLAPRAGGVAHAFGVAAMWTFCEWLRSWIITGFPWVALGYTQWNALPMARIASFSGVAGVTFILATANVGIAQCLTRFKAGERASLWRPLAAPAALVLVALAAGRVTTIRPTPDALSVRVAIVPGNIPQDERWDRPSLAKNLRTYIGLLETAAEGQPDLIVMPETAVPYPYLTTEDRALFADVAVRMGVPVLFGAPRVEADAATARRVVYNGALVLRPDGTFGAPYDKQHLVPFGEFIPLRRYMPAFLQRAVGVGDQQAGASAVILPVETTSALILAGVPICFESVFPAIAREFANEGANLIVVITNDGWYDGTAAIAQHNAFSVFRAIETGRTVVRAANRGISCFIDADGNTREHVIAPDDRGGIIVEDVPLLTTATVYARLGDWVSILSIVAVAGLLAARLYARATKADASGDAV